MLRAPLNFVTVVPCVAGIVPVAIVLPWIGYFAGPDALDWVDPAGTLLIGANGVLLDAVAAVAVEQPGRGLLRSLGSGTAQLNRYTPTSLTVIRPEMWKERSFSASRPLYGPHPWTGSCCRQW